MSLRRRGPASLRPAAGAGAGRGRWRRPTPTSGCSPGVRWRGSEGWLVATSRGLRVVPPQVTSVTDAAVLPWHEVGHARWTATNDGGGTFEVTALVEVEPGVQARQPAHALRAHRRR